MTPRQRLGLLQRHARAAYRGAYTPPLDQICDAALAICARHDRDDATALLQVLGIIAPPGAKLPRIQPGTAHPGGATPKPHSHMKRAKAK